MKEKSFLEDKDRVEDSTNPSADPKAVESIAYTRTRRIFITIGVMIGMFLAAIEATAVSTAMPTVVSYLGGLSLYSWVFSAYFLTSTVTLPLWGKLSDIYGRRIFYIIGITIFLLGSVLSGQSETMLQLIIYRALQGFGGGALLTLGMIVVGEIFSLKERAKVQGLFGGVWGLSSIIGPLIGGFLTDHLSWRWVFYLNIPFGVIAGLVIGFSLKETRSKTRNVSLDYSGALILTALITLLLLGLMQIGKENSYSSPIPLLMLGVCIPLLWLFIATERRAKDPILPLDLFLNPFFKTSAITGFLIGMAMFGSISFIPLFIQGVIGTTATRAGSILSPLLLTWVFFSSISGRLLLRFGYRPLIIFGSSLVALGFFLLSKMNENTTQGIAIINMIFLGCGMGMIFVPLLLSVQNSVIRKQLGIATSATQFFRLIGGTLGVTVMGVVMSAYMHHGFSSLSQDTNSSEITYLKNPDLILTPLARENLSPEVLEVLKGVLANSLHNVFITGFVIAILAFVSAFLVPREKVIDRKDKDYSEIRLK
ncbi:MAG: MFS transporter [Candidatus Dadabacteria bacterium]|nr:MFS transporter [Candidatus Dadabacteria bacterium]